MKNQGGFFPLFVILVLVSLVNLAATLPARSAPVEAELVIFNGKILTANTPDPNNFSIAQAAAIAGGKFLAVGSNQEVLQLAGPQTRRIDLAGRTVLPGLVETHDHIHEYATHFFTEQRPTNDPAITWSSKDEGLTRLRILALQKRPGEWIRTTVRGNFRGPSGRDTPVLALAVQKGELTRFDLDAVTPDNPVRIYSIFFSPTGDSLVNTKALEPLLARYPNLPGVHRDAQGVPRRWITKIRRAMVTLVPKYDTWRMVQEYTQKYYLPR